MTVLPKISIVTISFNQGRFLERTIQSVLDQGYQNLEYLIIDGGSTDNSIEIIKKYENHLTYWVSEKDRGQAHALNKGFEKCTGEMMGWLNSDDFFTPGALNAFAEAWHGSPEAGAWVGNGRLVDSDGKILETVCPGLLDRDSLADWGKNGFSQPACLFSRSAWQACKPMDESLFIAMDLALWLKIAGTRKFHRIDKVLSGATVHPDAKTQAFDNLRHIETWIVLLENGYRELAKKKMIAKLENEEEWKRKVAKISQNRAYKMVRPLVKMWLGNQRPSYPQNPYRKTHKKFYEDDSHESL